MEVASWMLKKSGERIVGRQKKVVVNPLDSLTEVCDTTGAKAKNVSASNKR
jgi:hypothetical protein